MLYRDMSLRSDRSNQHSRTISSPLDLASLRLAHAFLRSIDKNVRFNGFFPASIYVVRVKTSQDHALNFDYIDSIPDQCLAIRMNDIGIVALLRDGNLHEISLREQLPPGLLDREFNPVQFRNLFAKLLYQQMLFTDPLNYKVEPIGEDALKIEAVMKERDEFGHFYVYGPANQEDYGQVLAQVLGTSVDALRLPDGSIGSLLFDKQGQWKERPFDDDGSVLETNGNTQPTDPADKQ